jgi:hypothetical protein
VSHAGPPDKSSSTAVVDGDGVREVRLVPTTRRWWRRLQGLGVLALAALMFWLLLVPPQSSTPRAAAYGNDGKSAAVSEHGSTNTPAYEPVPHSLPPTVATAPAATMQRLAAPLAMPQSDPNDLASYVRPGDPEPSAAELIHALREAGETGGIAAFNPPGTSPPLPGLAVPEDYPLPPGFVRHHQVTDQGEPIEAILMFAPDHVVLDAQGQIIPLPENRVVPPELAPPGLPIRPVDIPPP